MRMDCTPQMTDFTAAYDAGKAVLVYAQHVADTLTPVAAALKLLSNNRKGFILESVVGGEVRGRYSLIGLDPDIIWHYDGTHARLQQLQADGSVERETPVTQPVMDSLRDLLAQSHVEIPAHLPPMAAGLVGYMGYETVCLMEKLPTPKPDPLHMPDGVLMRPRKMVIFDAVGGTVTLCTVARPAAGVDSATAYQQACNRLQQLLESLQQPATSTQPMVHMVDSATPALTFTPNMRREEYHAMVEKAKDYIVAGDIFQVVPSQRFSTPFPYSALALYRALRHLNPSPFLFYLHCGAFQLVGSSPEILVRARDGVVTIRPIAGTRKRGATAAEDAALAEELLADPKEISEHLMLLDLGRNDVGRVATTGTVQVTEQMIIERYSHVMHIVSNVQGQLRPDRDAVDALAAGFPAGTVSGAPKIRAMEIIHELEPCPRKFYAGCVGYFSADGNMDSCIALRTALVKDGMLHVQAGGGVVADSDPEAEYQESCNKAKAVMRAAELAYAFAN